MSREPLKPTPLAVQLLGKAQRWITFDASQAPTPGEIVRLAPLGHKNSVKDLHEDITAALDDWAVVDTYQFREPKRAGWLTSVGVVRITANVQRRSLRTIQQEVSAS